MTAVAAGDTKIAMDLLLHLAMVAVAATTIGVEGVGTKTVTAGATTIAAEAGMNGTPNRLPPVFETFVLSPSTGTTGPIATTGIKRLLSTSTWTTPDGDSKKGIDPSCSVLFGSLCFLLSYSSSISMLSLRSYKYTALR